MMIIDPVALGDTSFTRDGPGTYFDRGGVLQTALKDVMRVTYDPTALDTAPYALVEPAATNAVRNSTMVGAAAGTPGVLPNIWQSNVPAGLARSVSGVGVEDGIEYMAVRYSGTAAVAGVISLFFEASGGALAALGQRWAASAFVRLASGSFDGLPDGVFLGLEERGADGGWLNATQVHIAPTAGRLSAQRMSCVRTCSEPGTACVVPYLYVAVPNGAAIDFTLRIGLPQLQRDQVDSPIRTAGAAVTRAADVVGTTAGLVYSNVPIAEPSYSAAATYAKDAYVHDPTSHLTYQSLVAGNQGNALSDTTKWVKAAVTNRWKMLDQYNGTQTTAQDEIIIVLSPKQISQGVYLGNVDANDVRWSVVDLAEGLVYRETQSQLVSNSVSSFFNWCFRRIRRRTYAVSVLLPVYANALVTITISKPGSAAKCGMCAVGPLVDVGLSEWGIGTEIKDYSTTTFQFDGTSETVKRGFSRRMSVDVEIDNTQKDDMEEALAQFRQKPVAWIGTVLFGSACVFGRYSSFKNVLSNLRTSKCALQIEGTVN